MASTKSKHLSLRESSRILRPLPVEELTVPDSWNELIGEFMRAAVDGATGLVFINGPKGAGKSSFMKLLQKALHKDQSIHVLFGTVVESISEPGWLLPFMSEMVSGIDTATISTRALIDRLQELTLKNRGSLVLCLDGIDHIASNALAADFAGLLSLIEDSDLQLLIIANASEAVTSSQINSPLLSHKSTLTRTLPTLSDDEIKELLEIRLEKAELAYADLKGKLSSIITGSHGNPAKALRQLIEVAVTNEGATIEPATKAKSRTIPEPKAKKARPGKPTPQIQDPKPANPPKPETKNRSQASYDDLLTVKKLGS